MRQQVVRRANGPLLPILVLALTLLPAVVGLVLLETWATPAAPPVTLESVSAATLAEIGITLSTPPGSSTAISRAAAEQAVQAEFPGATVREAVLAHVDDVNTVPAIHRLCWVVSVGGIQPPSCGPAGSDCTQVAPPTYLLWILDATTGAFVEGTSGSQ